MSFNVDFELVHEEAQLHKEEEELQKRVAAFMKGLVEKKTRLVSKHGISPTTLVVSPDIQDLITRAAEAGIFGALVGLERNDFQHEPFSGKVVTFDGMELHSDSYLPPATYYPVVIIGNEGFSYDSRWRT